jgi:hypothetical protein
VAASVMPAPGRQGRRFASSGMRKAARRAGGSQTCCRLCEVANCLLANVDRGWTCQIRTRPPEPDVQMNIFAASRRADAPLKTAADLFIIASLHRLPSTARRDREVKRSRRIKSRDNLGKRPGLDTHRPRIIFRAKRLQSASEQTALRAYAGMGAVRPVDRVACRIHFWRPSSDGRLSGRKRWRCIDFSRSTKVIASGGCNPSAIAQMTRRPFERKADHS